MTLTYSHASSTCTDLSTSTSWSRAAICRLRLTYSAARTAANSRTMQMMRPADSHSRPLQLSSIFKSILHHIAQRWSPIANRFFPKKSPRRAVQRFSALAAWSPWSDHDPAQMPRPTASCGAFSAFTWRERHLDPQCLRDWGYVLWLLLVVNDI